MIQGIGVGKQSNKSIDEIVYNNSLPFIQDDDINNIWLEWEPSDRDVFIFKSDGTYCTKLNVNSEFNETDMICAIEMCQIIE